MNLKRRVAWGLAALLLAAAGVVALGVALIDTPAVRAEIQRRVSQAVDGQVAWEELDIGLLPPRAELRKVRVEIPGRLSAAADELNIDLRLWPLLRGRAEISSVTAKRPQVRVTPSKDSNAPLDAVALYRAAMEPLVRALKEFAPDMTLRLAGAEVDAAPLELRGLSASLDTKSEGFELELTAASNLWQRLSLKGQVGYAGLSARANVELDGLVLDQQVPAAILRAQLRTDGKSALECEFDGSLGSLVPAAKGRLLLPAGRPPQLAAELTGIDVAQGIALARGKGAPLDVVESAEGKISVKATASLGPPWRLDLEMVKSDAAVKLAQLPWKVSANAGRATVTQERVLVAGAKGAVGSSRFENVVAQVDFGGKPVLSSASGRATLELGQWFPWLQGKLLLEDVAALSGSVDVTLNRMALRFDRPTEPDYEADATLRQVSMTLKTLPGPLGIASGSMRFGRERARYEKLAVEMLDARALLSGTAEAKGPRVEFALDQGELGEKAVRWAMERGEVPPRLEPKTPLRFAARRIAWAPQEALEADARVELEGGPAVAFALAWRPELLELRRVAIKDARSDAVLGATVAADLIQASFSGTLHGASIAAMLRRPESDSGIAQGELRLTVDRAQPQRTTAEGRLRIEALDLTWLAGKKAQIERADIASDSTGVRVAGARFSWEDQVFELSGQGRQTERGPVIEAVLESPGVVLERLLAPPDPAAPQPAEPSRLWPLPVSGRLEVRAGFVQLPRHRIEPFGGVLTLEPKRARLEVTQARVCGVSFPLELEAQPDDFAVAAHLSMRDEPLEAAMRCLTGGTIEVTGTAELRAELKTKGRTRPELVRNLTGTAQGEVRNGRVMSFALIGNVLAFRDIASPAEMRKDGFPYRVMTARGHFQRGEFLVEEAFFDSNAARLAATGRVDLLGADSRLSVLVAPLTSIERVVGAIPLIGDVFGGTMVALPLSVNGDIRDPSVVPLGPRAITDQLLGIFERALKLPGKLVVPAN